MSRERIYCNTCKAQTWHEPAASYSHDRLDQLFGYSQQIDSCIFICCGCDDVSFRLVKHPFEFQDEEDEPEELVYPDRGFKFRDRKYFSGLPKNIERLYRETITTYDLGLLVLSTVGVRGLIEAIVADKIPGENYKDNLNSKIQALSPHFPSSVIELLHEGPQRPLGVGLNLPKHGRNYPYKCRHGDALYTAPSAPFQGRACCKR